MRQSSSPLVAAPLVVMMLLLASPMPGQLVITGSPRLEEFVRGTRTALARQGPPELATTTGDEEMARLVVAHLRLGNVRSARLALTNDASTPAETTAFAHATYQRTTGSSCLKPGMLRALDAALTRSEQLPNESFREAALRVHGRYCLALLHAAHERARHERTATTRLLLLEAETWQPGRGHYRPTPCNGRLLLPEPADATLLVPLSFGMRIATGNRFLEHLDNTLRAHELDATDTRPDRWRPDVLAEQQPALLLLAAAQLGDSQRLRRYYPEALARIPHDAGNAALQLDAVLQAITGIRLAAGAGTSERWLHCRPWLPPSCEQLSIDGIRILGRTLKLTMRRVTPGGATECAITLTSHADAQLSIVVGNRLQQFVGTTSPTEPFRCVLPAPVTPKAPAAEDGEDLPPHAEPDHKALDRHRFRAR